ncbi:hypothetical protein [Leptolyngbya sp. PCC 6406]|uniref:hypothetical protein n=1 Tax=Leptolyngbya sp. PCC 6406 TaxID=1173264 RepID=UPI0002AC43BC|nr:hypothetical protein [Leptolyngbya sp. PCC 6406]
MKLFNIGTFGVSLLSGIASAGLIFLWMFGVPGNPTNAYATGWKLGLTTLFNYIIGDVLILLTYGILFLVSLANIPNCQRVFFGLSLFFWLFFGFSMFQLIRAFVIMFSV